MGSGSGSGVLRWWGLLSVSVSWEGVGVSSPVIAWCPLVEFPSVFKGLRVTNGAYGGVSQKHTGRGATRGTVPIYIYLYTHSVSPTHTTSLTTQ